MSCHSTSGGIVSTSLARAVTGLSEKEIQHIFHALKREANGMASPSELDVQAWRSRQYELLQRMKRMSDTRRDKMRDRLFRSRSESIPDGSTFYAWNTIEARARQEVALAGVSTAVDLDPPGSQSHLYDLGEDGRPKRVWYASYGSNLHRDRFMNYIQGGSPQGSTRTYDGCTDPTEPSADIPIRFAGARPHFALTSRVWRGGIAFIDQQKDESAQGLGRAYDISIDQFDEVVAQENGLPTKFATAVPLDEALTTGRSVIGNGSYETILHIGDYQGAPVLTFTAPFSTQEALSRTGNIVRQANPQATPVRMPVMTNKPSPAYLRMIGGGLKETFDMDEVAQADYLRGCPGGDRWTRQQMVRILRGQEPDPPRLAGPEQPGTSRATSGSVTSLDSKRGKKSRRSVPASKDEDDKGYRVIRSAVDPEDTRPRFSHAARAEDDAAARAADASVLADLRERGLFPASDLMPGATRNPGGSRSSGNVVTRSWEEVVEERRARAAALAAENWERSTNTSGRGRSGSAKGSGRSVSRGSSSDPSRGSTGGSSSVQTRRNSDGERELPGVKRYGTTEDQQIGVTKWQKTVEKFTRERNSIHASVTKLDEGMKSQHANGASLQAIAASERNLLTLRTRLAEADRMVEQAVQRLNAARSQTPDRFYNTGHRTKAQWMAEDERVLQIQRAAETTYDQKRQELSRMTNGTPAKEREDVTRHIARMEKVMTEAEARLKEIHQIVTTVEP